MPLTDSNYAKSEYDKELEANINTQLSNLSASITSLDASVVTLYAITSATITNTLTLNVASVRAFNVLNDTTAGKTLMLTGVPTAASTFTEININLNFTTTATITYTGTITWSVGTAGVTASPTPTAVGTFTINLKTFDNGTNWRGTYNGLY